MCEIVIGRDSMEGLLDCCVEEGRVFRTCGCRLLSRGRVSRFDISIQCERLELRVNQR